MTSHQALVAFVAVLAAVVALLGLSVTLVSRAHSSEQVKVQTQAQCHAIENLKGAIRMVFSDQLDSLEQRRNTMNPEQYVQAHAYFERQLDRFRQEECS